MFTWLGIQGLIDLLGFAKGKKERVYNQAVAQVPVSNQPVSDAPSQTGALIQKMFPLILALVAAYFLFKNRKKIRI